MPFDVIGQSHQHSVVHYPDLIKVIVTVVYKAQNEIKRKEH